MMNFTINVKMDQISDIQNQQRSRDILYSEPKITETILTSSQFERRPNWWRGSDSENILDPCFKKPIYTGKSKFNFLPTFLKDNIKWFKHRILSNINHENDYRCNEYEKKTMIEYGKQLKMTQKQEYSQYKYISPYSEYLLERLKWKIALRIYYTLDPNDKGYIELEHSKKLLFEMLKVDTEKAQSLLLLLETIKPFYAKDGCIEKNDIISYLSREIFDDTRGYGLFSKLNNIFKNPISRSKRQNDYYFSNNFQEFSILKKNEKICFSSDPSLIKINQVNFGKINLKETNCNFAHCHKNKETCITCNMKKNCIGKLKDHIKTSKDRKQRLIERIKQEQKEINDESMLNCTFKPEIIWPIGKFILKSNKNWLRDKKNIQRTKLPLNKKNNISGYQVINEQDIDDKNIQVFLNSNCNSGSYNNWSGYIHDSMTNQIFVIHKGYLTHDNNMDKNEIFYRKTDKEDQKEIRNKVLDSIIRKVHNEFQSLESTENGNEQKNSLNFGTKKLIEGLRTERETGTNDPRLNTPEFTIEINHPEFVEKSISFSAIKPYKEAVNHENFLIKSEYPTSPCYYYLPKGYERIGNCFNEIHFRRKLDFFNNNERDNLNTNKRDNSNLKGSLNLSTNKTNFEGNSPLCLKEELVEEMKMKKIQNISNETNKTNPLLIKNSNGVDSQNQNNNIDIPNTRGMQTESNNLNEHSFLKNSYINDNAQVITKSNNIDDETEILRKNITTQLKKEFSVSVSKKNNLKILPKKDDSVAKLKKETVASISAKSNPKVPSKKDNLLPLLKEEAGTLIPKKNNLKILTKKDSLVTLLKSETAASISTKNILKIPLKKDKIVNSLKKETRPSIQLKQRIT
ncbi:uncharacterized protein cubi_02960 [Cryptosporidium ubiquitum]|uniref:Uncharacterized protein n=1 Tax=Cryptosporidium ubiquitum TaxID=857276 RepID=A0A1J4MIY5_9CRYT|nr:uncharacterized protein cubi_02960 [Cryptosporidium ubiquitum]OII74158.1 hypothetical protein cubi_02960 [Cryptosporidium ubiquitum]